VLGCSARPHAPHGAPCDPMRPHATSMGPLPLPPHPVAAVCGRCSTALLDGLGALAAKYRNGGVWVQPHPARPTSYSQPMFHGMCMFMHVHVHVMFMFTHPHCPPSSTHLMFTLCFTRCRMATPPLHRCSPTSQRASIRWPSSRPCTRASETSTSSRTPAPHPPAPAPHPPTGSWQLRHGSCGVPNGWC
jgi:hypothetical protein